jgi:predicted DNA-binding transcriptional regulator AlpA
MEIDPLIPRRKALRLMGISPSTGDRREKQDPDFPERVQIGPNRWAHRSSDVQRWIETRPVLRRGPDEAASRPVNAASVAAPHASPSPSPRQRKEVPR